MISQQSVMIAKLLIPQDQRPTKIRSTETTRGSRSTPIDIEDDVAYKFKCKACNFEADRPATLDNHITEKHRQVDCPMCDYSNSSGAEVTKHMQDKHPEKTTSDEQPSLLDCPIWFNLVHLI